VENGGDKTTFVVTEFGRFFCGNRKISKIRSSHMSKLPAKFKIKVLSLPIMKDFESNY
jgi:hypothetical protein